MSTMSFRGKQNFCIFILLNKYFKSTVVASCIINSMASLFYRLKKNRNFMLRSLLVLFSWKWDLCTWEQNLSLYFQWPFCTFCPLVNIILYNITKIAHHLNTYMQSSPLQTKTENMVLSYDPWYFVSLLCKKILM